MRIIFLTALLINVIFAISLTPMYHTIDNRKQLKTFFTVKNPTNKPVAVKFSILQLVDTDNNKEKRIPAPNINYYPSQFVLDANSSKNVRVSYLKRTLPKVEEVYRVLADELNVDVEDRKVETTTDGKIKAEIKMRFSYAGLLFVKDSSAKANLKVQNFKSLPNGNVEITIFNSGTASALFNTTQYNLKATVNGKDYILNNDDLKNAEFRRILPNKSNRYILKNIKSLPTGKISSMRIETK